MGSDFRFPKAGRVKIQVDVFRGAFPYPPHHGAGARSCRILYQCVSTPLMQFAVEFTQITRILRARVRSSGEQSAQPINSGVNTSRVIG